MNQAILDTEHVDVGINYEDGARDLHIHDETHDIEYEPDEAILRVNGSAQTTELRHELELCGICPVCRGRPRRCIPEDHPSSARARVGRMAPSWWSRKPWRNC